MKILNLYSGIGGNRKLWGDKYEITSVEYNEEIAEVYKSFFPNDTVVVGDAHQYLLDHYKEFDFIRSSPPCPTHSDIRRCGVHSGQYEAKYPEMDLYQEIILLQNFAPLTQKWVIENVRPYYTPLIKPTSIIIDIIFGLIFLFLILILKNHIIYIMIYVDQVMYMDLILRTLQLKTKDKF